MENMEIEIWKALNSLREAAEKQAASIERIALAVNCLREIAEASEKRLDKIEVVQRWLAEKERKRETGQA